MQRLINFVIILGFISPCLCTRLNVGTKDGIYNVMDYGARGDGKSDDTQAFASAWSNICKARGKSTLIIPAGKSFFVTKVHFSGPCNAKIHIQLEGKIVAPPKEAWKGGEKLILIENLDGLTIDGNGEGGAYGDGSTWWNCPGGCEHERPGILHFHSCKDLSVRNIKITNSPRSHISVNNCIGATFSQISIDSPAISPNTDGFDISFSKNILVEDSNIKSGDDCIAINGGSFFINATRITCGPGHGISVGSLGKVRDNDQVSDVYVRNCTFIGTTNGGRIKTVSGGSGYAKRITFEEINLVNVKNPIIIDQHYPKDLELDSDVSVSEVTYRGFTGTCEGNVAVKFECRKNLSTVCHNAHGTATNTIPVVSCLQQNVL
ncbi:probable polygalacturonase At3g15720 [Trifolium pratense]|uniref:probable polygalacturonase At3g15720 n=1 Tax=Trifolium pratense TaxID=57577 RepID=UPI001E692574|nr:probable polygalacturonase At3g15720 [Trifolium pratense]